jgi:hypothetical protein
MGCAGAAGGHRLESARGEEVILVRRKLPRNFVSTMDVAFAGTTTVAAVHTGTLLTCLPLRTSILTAVFPQLAMRICGTVDEKNISMPSSRIVSILSNRSTPNSGKTWKGLVISAKFPSIVG